MPIPPDSEIFKTQDGTAGATVSANGEIDFGNVDLSQMDPEVIRVMFHVNFSAPFDGQPNSTTCLVFAYSGACSSSFIPVPTFRLPPSIPHASIAIIQEELQRVYTQLHVLKMKTLRKDNPHISKRRGGRKSTHRRFSLQVSGWSCFCTCGPGGQQLTRFCSSLHISQ